MTNADFITCRIDYLTLKFKKVLKKLVSYSRDAITKIVTEQWLQHEENLPYNFGGNFGKYQTQMAAASTQSSLDGCLNPPINSSSDYVAPMRMACSEQPYDVEILDNECFSNYSAPETNPPEIL